MYNNSYKRWHKPNTTGTKSEGGTSITHQGYYKNLANPDKYIGDVNLIIYRSSWEFSFIKWCDALPSILRWSSEPIKIPYLNKIAKLEECKKFGLNPNNPKNWVVSNYHIDFWVEINKGGERPEKWFIEIKPKDKLKKPTLLKENASIKEQKRFNTLAKEYLINEAKWQAMADYAKKNNSKFYVFHEDIMIKLGILGGRFSYDKEKYKTQK
jgi:hypothetical protein